MYNHNKPKGRDASGASGSPEVLTGMIGQQPQQAAGETT